MASSIVVVEFFFVMVRFMLAIVDDTPPGVLRLAEMASNVAICHRQLSVVVPSRRGAFVYEYLLAEGVTWASFLLPHWLLEFMSDLFWAMWNQSIIQKSAGEGPSTAVFALCYYALHLWAAWGVGATSRLDRAAGATLFYALLCFES